MKRLVPLTLILLLCFSITPAFAQIELTPFGGYVFQDRFNTIYGYAYVHDAALYGVDLGIPVKSGAELELSYERQDSHLFTDNYSAPQFANSNIPVAINYILIGGVYGKNLGDGPIQPYGGVAMGTVYVAGKSTSTEHYDSEWLFDVRMKLGVKFFPNDGSVGIRLQSQLNVPMQFAGSGIGCGTVAGCGVYVDSYTTITQFGLSGGIIFKIGGNKPTDKIYYD